MAVTKRDHWVIKAGCAWLLGGCLVVAPGCDSPAPESQPPAGGGASPDAAPNAKATPIPASGCTPEACSEQGAKAFEAGEYADAVEPLTYACTNNQAQACLYLGKLYERGNRVDQDFAQAAKLYEQACDGGNGEGCQRRAHLARNGRGQGKDAKQAFGFYKRACDAGDGLGCSGAGDMMYAGKGVAESTLGAIEFFERACEKQQLVSCLNAGELLFEPTGEEALNKRAVAALTRGCDGGNGAACVKLGLCYYKGIGVTADPAEASARFKAGCDAGAEDGCHVGRQLEKARGKSVELELTTAVESSNIDGLNAKNLSCRMREQGFLVIGEMMSSLGKQKSALDKCADGEAIKISWSFAKRRISSVEVTGASTPKVKKCVERAIKKTRSTQHGRCEVTLLIGDPGKAAAAFKAQK
ncbi:MAG: tetratricopeptide repeat protein [Nannocystaceae bacterium]